MRFTSIEEKLELTKSKKVIERELESYFEEMGFSLIKPGMFQRYDKYINSVHKRHSSKTVKVLSGDARIYILRPDITLNVLKEIYYIWDRKTPLKIYYNSETYSIKSDGKILENHQMGIEYLGDGIYKSDIEIIEIAATIMEKINNNFIIELGSNKYLDNFFNEIELDKKEKKEVRNMIGNKNRQGLSTKLKSLGIKNSILDSILDMQGDIEEVINLANSYDMNKGMKEALKEIENIREYLKDKSIRGNIKLDLSMISNVNYYDGIIFQGYYINSPYKVLSGGRYDKLTEDFGLNVPAVGFMIDIDSITRIKMGGKI